MLELQIGLNSEKRYARLMCEMKEAAELGGDIFLLVPDQSTYTHTKKACETLGNDFVNQRVHVVGFDKLFEIVHKELGGKKRYLDDGGRLMAMAMAADNCAKRGELSVYKGLASRPEFLTKLLSAHDLMAMHGVTPDALRKKTEGLDNKPLREKVTDMANLFDEYTAICEKARENVDQTEEFVEIAKLISTHNWGKGSHWFITGYSDFPANQMQIIDVIMPRCASMLVDLAISDLNDDKPGREIASYTARTLKEYAESLNIYGGEIYMPNKSSEHPALGYLQETLCDSTPAEPAEIPNAGKVVKLFKDPSPYQECQHIAGTIMRAIRNGYRYQDISVVLPDYDRYSPILASVFRRYDIPVHLASRKNEMGKQPVMLAVFGALDCATHGMQRTDVIQYLKSGLSALTTAEADELENYAMTWNIHGRGWEPKDGEWVMSPSGYGSEMTDAEKEQLAHLNELRVKGITPLLTLRDALYEHDNIAEKVEDIYNFLDATGFNDKLQAVVDNLMASDNEQLANEFAQVAGVLADAMEQMHEIIGESTRRPADFAKLFRMLCSAYRIATIPVSIDQVEVFDLLDARYSTTKLRYIAGCEEGVFPAYVNETGLLDTEEVKELNKCDIEIPGTTKDITQRSLTDINTVVAGATKMLVLSYASDPATPTTPSHLYTRVELMFPGIEPSRGCGENGIYDADLLLPEMTGRLLGRIYQRKAYSEIAMDIASMDNDVVQESAFRVMEKAAWEPGDLSRVTVRDLYGDTVRLSASRSDIYSSCRYRYFLQYGIGLHEQAKGKVNSPVFGRFVHYVLEQSVKEVEHDYGGFQTISMDTVADIVSKHIKTYTETKLKGIEDQPERYIYLYKRNCREVVAIMRDVFEEMQRSDFHTTATEFRIGGEEQDTPPIRISGSTANGLYTGVVDRVDECVVNGKNVLRIKDYKTGKTKTIDYTDILNGMTLQVLMYMTAFTQKHVDPTRTGAIPGACEYQPAKLPIVVSSTRMPEDKVKAEREKMLKRRGIYVDDVDIVNAMEHPDSAGKYIHLPIRSSASGQLTGDVCSASDFNALLSYTNRMMEKIVDGISSGAITPNPISRGPKSTSCTYCPMKGACHRDICGTKFKFQRQIKSDEFWNIVRNADA